MRMAVFTVGLLARSGPRDVVHAPVTDAPGIVAPPPVAAASSTAIDGSSDAAPEAASVASVEGTTWTVCSNQPDPLTMTLLPGGGMRCSGTWAAVWATRNEMPNAPLHSAQCPNATWTQADDRLVLDFNHFTVWEVHITRDQLIGRFHRTATPDRTMRACFRRVGPRP